MPEIINTILIPLVIGIGIGVALLVLEYRTQWFANWRNNSEKAANRGIKGRHISSRKGGIRVRDTTGQGIDVEHLNSAKDVEVTNELQPNQPSASLADLIGAADHIVNSMGLKAEKIFAGGNITIQQFLNNQLPLTQQIEFFSRQIGLPYSHHVNYNNSQYKAYCDVWKTLQSLRLTGDDLWQEATTENLIRFANELRETKLLVNQKELFFEEEDRQELLKLLRVFGNYRLGKLSLIEIRSKQDAEFLPSDEEIQNQIEMNRKDKKQYEELLERIRISFKKRLTDKQR